MVGVEQTAVQDHQVGELVVCYGRRRTELKRADVLNQAANYLINRGLPTLTEYAFAMHGDGAGSHYNFRELALLKHFYRSFAGMGRAENQLLATYEPTDDPRPRCLGLLITQERSTFPLPFRPGLNISIQRQGGTYRGNINISYLGIDLDGRLLEPGEAFEAENVVALDQLLSSATRRNYQDQARNVFIYQGGALGMEAILRRCGRIEDVAERERYHQSILDTDRVLRAGVEQLK